MGIAVTGALGFIGSAVVKALNDIELSEIDLIDYSASTPSRKDPNWRNLTGLVFNRFCTPLEFDPNDYEVVFHLGANVDDHISFSDAMVDYNYTIDLIGQLKPETRLVYASSAQTYGTDGFSFSDECVHELQPRCPYAMGKHMVDQYVAINEKPNVLGVKFANVFGPGESHKGGMASEILKWHNLITEGNKCSLYKPQDELARDFIYVKDAARMMVELGLSDESPTGCLNIGSGVATTFREVLDVLMDVMGRKDYKVGEHDIPERLQYQFQRFTKLDMSNTKKYLDDPTVMDLRDAIAEYVTYLELGLRIGEPCQAG